MEICFYGTAAAEGIPGLYCSCTLCEQARTLGGKEIRSRHLSQVDEDIQFDLGPDAFYQVQALGLNLRKISHLVITHHHADHLDVTTLDKRAQPYALVAPRPLTLYASQQVQDVIVRRMGGVPDKHGITFTSLVPFVPQQLDADTVLTALPANHAIGHGAFVYLLARRGKKLLYAHDTGPLLQEVLDFLAGQQLDAITLDCTGVYLGAGDHHLDLAGCEMTVAALTQNGALQQNAKVVLNHFSHGGGALHHQIVKEAKAWGWLAAFDGFRLQV